MIDCEYAVKKYIALSDFGDKPKTIIMFLEKLKTDYLLEIVEEKIINSSLCSP